MNDREKNAALLRAVVAQSDLESLDQFMAQYSRAAVAEWLVSQMPPEARRVFLRSLAATYESELSLS